MSQATDRRADGSLGALGREVADDVMRLARAEVGLAVAQLKAAAIRLLVAIVLFVIAMTFVFIAVIEALSAVPAHYSQSILGNNWLGWVVFGGVFFVIALVLGGVGTIMVFRTFKAGKDTVHTFKEDAEWAKGLTKRGSGGS